MKFERLRIPDVILLTPTIYNDERGRFMETFRTRDLFEAATKQDSSNFVQGNFSTSIPWTLRGLHYQYPNPQGKLVQCVLGKIYDVAVDLRADSPTYGKYVGAVLDSTDCKLLWVPPGFAHGFLTFDTGTNVHYECTTYYADEYAKDLKWDDPDIGITWPIKMGQTPVISQKDRKAKSFRDTEPLKI